MAIPTTPISALSDPGSLLLNDITYVVRPSDGTLGSRKTTMAEILALASFDPLGSAAAVQLASLEKTDNLATLASAAAARTNLGLGTAATHAATDFDAAGAAAAAQAAAQAASDPLGSAAAVSSSINTKVGPWIGPSNLILHGTTTNPTKGGIAADAVRYRRVGNVMHGSILYQQTIAGVAGSGDYLVGIPGGLSIDVTLVTNSNAAAPANMVASCVGDGVIYDSSSNQIRGVQLFPYNNGFMRVLVNVANNFWSDSYAPLNASLLTFSANFEVPIVGW